MKNKLFGIILVFISFFFFGWGYVGHNKISSNATNFFPQEMNDFLYWKVYLTAHASDADSRKGDDPTEGYKHYIDIDNYSIFLSSGRIPTTMDSIITMYGLSFVNNQGILPWSTISTVDSITSAFSIKDFEKALFYAADLGHYVGDGNMPLHITKNYNGQLSGQNGVHSRYESTMIGKYSEQINYSGDSIQYINNVPKYIFQYLYQNYAYVDTILIADKNAKSFANGNTSSDLYYQKLWELTKNYTIILFRNASKTIANLIYTAWVNAGSPELNPSAINDNTKIKDFYLWQNYPNPFGKTTPSGNHTTSIRYSISEASTLNATSTNISLKVYDILGREVETLVNKNQSAGNYKVNFSANNLPAGIYFYTLISDKFVATKKFIYLK